MAENKATELLRKEDFVKIKKTDNKKHNKSTVMQSNGNFYLVLNMAVA